MMNSELKGKRILLFAPSFFNYERLICEKMESLGATVQLHDERSVKSSYLKALLKIDPRLLYWQSDKYYGNILDSVKDISFDYIIFIKCEMISEKMLSKYRMSFPKSKFILYLWDSVSNIKHVLKKIKHFDSVLTFDRKDAQKYKHFSLRPLFFIEDFVKYDRNDVATEGSSLYDISFVGTIHSDRYKILRILQQQSKQKGYAFYSYGYFQNRLVYWFYRATRPEYRGTHPSMFKYEKVSSKQVRDIVDSSKVILDIQHPKQTGLTMRTIEMVGCGKKIATTNAEISFYDLYSSSNVCIIDRDNPTIPDEFLLGDSSEMSSSILDKYSLESWVLDLVASPEKSNSFLHI